METTTLRQGEKLLKLFEDTPSEQTQDVFGSGLLTDIRDANLSGVTPETRAEIRRLLGFKTASERSPFSLWGIIRIGGTAKTGLQRRLKSEGFHISASALDIMGKDAFRINPQQEVSLVRPALADLGFKNLATFKEIISRAREFGYGLCPAEVGPYLRLLETDQPLGNRYWVAMEPIVGSDGHRHVFYVGRSGSGKRWLNTYCVYDGSRWLTDSRFVFLSRLPAERAGK